VWAGWRQGAAPPYRSGSVLVVKTTFKDFFMSPPMKFRRNGPRKPCHVRKNISKNRERANTSGDFGLLS
jgi:hypothetical protein